jgi:hypothetical protein
MSLSEDFEEELPESFDNNNSWSNVFRGNNGRPNAA